MMIRSTQNPTTQTIAAKIVILRPLLDERARRLWAAVEARAIGRGGISYGAEATGLSRVTIRAGVQDLVLPGTAPGPRARSSYAVRAGAASYSECGSRISCMPWTPWSTRSALDETSYPTGREVTPQQLESLAITQEKFHGEWNYTIQPRT